MECIFCRIAAGEIPADIVSQDDEFIAFRDIKPQAPKHILVVPRMHIGALTDLDKSKESLMGRLILTAQKVAVLEKISATGFRLVINSGTDGGQIVPHLHLHILGGRRLDDQLG
jgi:histidine triad (HIT) family protein